MRKEQIARVGKYQRKAPMAREQDVKYGIWDSRKIQFLIREFHIDFIGFSCKSVELNLLVTH